MIHRWHSLWLVVCLWILSAAALSVRAEEGVGLTAMRPSQGRYVKTDRGYMVPYRTTIPGTDVVFEMVPVRGSTFRMRSRQDRASEVEVTIEPFWLGRYEVTWSEYDQYCDLLKPFTRFQQLGIRKVTDENQIDAVTAPSAIYDPRMYFPAMADRREWPKHPATAMTQYGAKQYTKWLSKLTGRFYRLPSEAEWEYACRAGSTTSFCFGDGEGKLADYAWYFDSSDEDTHPVGLKKPNRWGLYDMHGNVSEWVLDQFSETYAPLRKAVAAGEPPIQWPTRLHPRTVCGGSWDSDAVDCQSATRAGSSVEWQQEEPMVPPSPHWLACSFVGRTIGFRIARPLNPPPIKSHAKYWDADVDELKKAVTEYTSNGHSYKGIVDPELPAAIRRLQKQAK